MSSLWGTPKPENYEPSPPPIPRSIDKATSLEFFEVPRAVYRKNPSYFSCSSLYVFHISSCTYPLYFFIFRGLGGIPISPPLYRPCDFKKFQVSSSFEWSLLVKNSHFSSYFLYFFVFLSYFLHFFIYPEVLGHRKILSSPHISYELRDLEKSELSRLWTWNMHNSFIFSSYYFKFLHIFSYSWD